MNKNKVLFPFSFSLMVSVSHATDDFSYTINPRETLLEEKRRIESSYAELLSLEDIQNNITQIDVPVEDLKLVQELAKRTTYDSLIPHEPFEAYFQTLPSKKRIPIAQMTIDYLLVKPNAENNYVYFEGEKWKVFSTFQYEAIVNAVLQHHQDDIQTAYFLSWLFKKNHQNVVKDQFIEKAITRFKNRFFSYIHPQTQQPLFLEQPFHIMFEEGMKGVYPHTWVYIFKPFLHHFLEAYQTRFLLNPKSRELIHLKKNIWKYYAQLLKSSPYWETKSEVGQVEDGLQPILRYLEKEGVFKVRPRFSPRVKELKEYQGITVDEFIAKYFPDQLKRMEQVDPHHMEVLRKYGERERKKFEGKIQRQKEREAQALQQRNSPQTQNKQQLIVH